MAAALRIPALARSAASTCSIVYRAVIIGKRLLFRRSERRSRARALGLRAFLSPLGLERGERDLGDGAQREGGVVDPADLFHGHDRLKETVEVLIAAHEHRHVLL